MFLQCRCTKPKSNQCASSAMERTSRRRPSSPTAARAAAVLAALVLLVVEKTRRSGHSQQEGTAQTGPPAAALPAACQHWASVERLPSGCLGALQLGGSFRGCCSGALQNASCSPCSEEVVAALQCLTPRRMLLRPAPGCGAALDASAQQQQRLSSGSRCDLSAAAVANGTWEAATPAELAAAPALPRAFFRLAAPGSGDGAACQQPRRLHRFGAAEVAPRCLWAAGFDRVVISGDSSIRHLFNRLVSLLRQQPSTIDVGGMQHGHYALHLQRDSGGYFATDSLWYSPTGVLAAARCEWLQAWQLQASAAPGSPIRSRPTSVQKQLAALGMPHLWISAGEPPLHSY